ncbi:UNKNOWN [Stylonychia lemnae]|uniref:Uncharacterized protein n=1 Tax=Stylonychia lemnae TaxID=5949 RepID=A0A078B2D6_STYLE|nr:UNKNOWN [Stylonychia lemnae]|eukprot:CDW88710.1 UNKNOWN [Stylonychia lemnae]
MIQQHQSKKLKSIVMCKIFILVCMTGTINQYGCYKLTEADDQKISQIARVLSGYDDNHTPQEAIKSTIMNQIGCLKNGLELDSYIENLIENLAWEIEIESLSLPSQDSYPISNGFGNQVDSFIQSQLNSNGSRNNH